MSKAKSAWTEEKTELLKEMWCEKGYTATKIAEHLSLTKNAVIGKVNRLGLKKQTVKAKPSVSKDSTKQKFSKFELAELASDQCVWPYGEDHITFCGKKVDEKTVYCEEHNKMSFIKSNRKTLQEEIFLTKEDLDAEE